MKYLLKYMESECFKMFAIFVLRIFYVSIQWLHWFWFRHFKFMSYWVYAVGSSANFIVECMRMNVQVWHFTNWECTRKTKNLFNSKKHIDWGFCSSLYRVKNVWVSCKPEYKPTYRYLHITKFFEFCLFSSL